MPECLDENDLKKFANCLNKYRNKIINIEKALQEFLFIFTINKNKKLLLGINTDQAMIFLGTKKLINLSTILRYKKA